MFPHKKKNHSAFSMVSWACFFLFLSKVLLTYWQNSWLNTKVYVFDTGRSGPWFNMKVSSFQYRKSHCGDKTILRLSYLHNGISYTGKTTSLYWIRALDAILKMEFSILFYFLESSDHLMMMPSDECQGTLLMISQYEFRYWLGAIWQQTIIWTYFD